MFEPTTFDAVPDSSDATFSHSFPFLGGHGHGSDVSSNHSGNIHNGHRIDGLTHSEWRKIVIAARRFAIMDPICRQTIRLYTDHALGNGVTFQVASDNKNKREKAKSVVAEFLADPTNQRQLSTTGQRKNSDRLGIDGNWYVALHETNQKPKVKIRRLDTLQITEHVTNPKDVDDVWFYLRETVGKGGITTTKRLYPDISKHGTDLNELKVKDPDDPTGETKIPYLEWAATKEIKLVENVWVYHASWNSTEQRGNPTITTQMIWSKQFRRFTESRIALQQARTQLVREEILEGGAAAVQARQRALQSSITATHPRENNPANIPGGTAIHNEGYTLKNIEQKTAAPDAKIDGDMLMQVSTLGASMFPQYYGQESYRLATQRSIESPMMKAFKAFQKTLGDTFEAIIQFVFKIENVPEDQRVVDLDFPEIVDKARPEQMEMLKKHLELFPQDAQSDEVRSFSLSLVGLNNPEQIIEEVGEGEEPEPEVASETHENALIEMKHAFGRFTDEQLALIQPGEIAEMEQGREDWNTAMGEE